MPSDYVLGSAVKNSRRNFLRDYLSSALLSHFLTILKTMYFKTLFNGL